MNRTLTRASPGLDSHRDLVRAGIDEVEADAAVGGFGDPGGEPQRRVGHPALVARLRAQLEAYPGLEFAGGPLGAYGLPDVIAEGEAAAERLLERVVPRAGDAGL